MALSTVTVSCQSGEEKESTLEGTASKEAQTGPLKIDGPPFSIS